MSSIKVTKRYAQAFFQWVLESKELDAVMVEVRALCEVLSQSQELHDFFQNPILTKEQKENTLKKVFEGRVHAQVYRFMLFLISKSRLNMTQDIFQNIITLYEAYKNVVPLQITSAFNLDQSQVDNLIRRFKETLHKDIHAQVIVDRSLIGGVKLSVQDQVYDFSFKTQLEKFRQSIVTS